MRILSVIILSCLISAAHARIGETFEQCTQRYGAAKTTTIDRTKAEYKVDAVLVICWFHEGICDAVSYRVSLPMGADAKQLTFNFDQCVKLLNFNSKNIQWSQTEKRSFGREWNGVYLTADKALWADVSEYGINIDSVASRAREIRLAQADELNKSIASFGADDSTAAPIANAGDLPPTQDEIEREKVRKTLDDLQKKVSQ